MYMYICICICMYMYVYVCVRVYYIFECIHVCMCSKTNHQNIRYSCLYLFVNVRVRTTHCNGSRCWSLEHTLLYVRGVVCSRVYVRTYFVVCSKLNHNTKGNHAVCIYSYMYVYVTHIHSSRKAVIRCSRRFIKRKDNNVVCICSYMYVYVTHTHTHCSRSRC